MTQKVDQLQPDVRPRDGSCFTIVATTTYDTDKMVPGTLTFNVTNEAKSWIEFQADGYYPRNFTMWFSGPLLNGQSDVYSTQLQFYTGWTIHITRWGPGIFGIAGNGGGEAFLTLPSFGDVTINVTVTS